MARLEELEAADQRIREGVAARRAAYSETIAFPIKYSAQAPDSRRLEQSQENLKRSVRDEGAATPRTPDDERPASGPSSGHSSKSSPQQPISGIDNAIGSPKGASFGRDTKPEPSRYAEMVRQELVTAARVCPRLAPLVTPALLADPAGATPEDAARVAAAAATYLPEPERNNDQTAIWGWRKHGIRIVTMMAIALEDPEVRSPCGYFGRLATQERGAADLRLNLARILRQQGEALPVEPPPAVDEPEPPPLMFAPGADTPPWPEINGALRHLIKDGAHGSWFGRVGFHGLEGGLISLSTPTSLAADRIKRDYLEAIKLAAESVGVFVDRVMISVRKR